MKKISYFSKNSLIVELRTLAKLIGEEGRQAEFYRQMIQDAKPIEVVRLSELFSPTEIKEIKRSVNPKVKECYRNATIFSHIYPEVKYVEGKYTVCRAFGIEHAWNKVGDKYVDITMELALDRDPTKEEYMALGEYDRETVVSVCSEVGFYGSVYQILYSKQKDRNISKTLTEAFPEFKR